MFKCKAALSSSLNERTVCAEDSRSVGPPPRPSCSGWIACLLGAVGHFPWHYSPTANGAVTFCCGTTLVGMNRCSCAFWSRATWRNKLFGFKDPFIAAESDLFCRRHVAQWWLLKCDWAVCVQLTDELRICLCNSAKLHDTSWLVLKRGTLALCGLWTAGRSCRLFSSSHKKKVLHAQCLTSFRSFKWECCRNVNNNYLTWWG